MKQDVATSLIDQLRLEGIQDERVLAAVASTPRELFVPEVLSDMAYEDRALPIQCGQTISQPYVVARMSEAILARGTPSHVLEIGTGSGYQAAVLSQLFSNVYSIERIKYLYEKAKLKLARYKNIHLHYGDGFAGWAAHSPFDRIIVTAAAKRVPEALLTQLSEEGGEMIIPVEADFDQQLQWIQKQGEELKIEYLDNVIFVPMLPGCE